MGVVKRESRGVRESKKENRFRWMIQRTATKSAERGGRGEEICHREKQEGKRARVSKEKERVCGGSVRMTLVESP